MGKHIFKLLTSSLLLTTLTCPIVLTSCNKSKHDDKPTPQEPKLESIEILTNFTTIILEVKQEYTSSSISVQCKNTNKEIIVQETKLELTPISNDLDISIVDNKIHIGADKKKGLYKYQLVAKSLDGTISSESKTIDIYVYEEKEIDQPDEINLSGLESKTMYLTQDEPIDYQIIGKLEGKEIIEFDPTCELKIIIESSTTGLVKDIFNNPLFSLSQNNKTVTFNVSTNVDARYEGKYKLKFVATLKSNPDVSTTKTLTLDLENGMLYKDPNTNFVYARDSLELPWYLKSAPSDTTIINKSNLLTSIKNIQVLGVGNNFCSNSSINKLVKIILPEQYIFIGDYAFDNQEFLSSMHIQNVEYIGNYAFNNCSQVLTSSQYTYKFKYIGNYAFNNCSDLKFVSLPDIVSLGEGCFQNTYTPNIVLGPNLQWLGSGVFEDCSNLTRVDIQTNYVPNLLGEFMGMHTSIDTKIHVRTNIVDLYRNDPNWAIYSDRLVGDL